MGAFDFFFASQPVDGTWAKHINHFGTTNAGATLNAQGTTFTVSAAPSPPFFVGEHVYITDYAKVAYCAVTWVSGTSVTLLPVQSTLDTAGVLGYTFISGSLILSTNYSPTRAATLVIDLSEAPEAAYSYLIAGCGLVSADTAAAISGAALRTEALVDDPYAGTANVGVTRVTHTTTAQAYNFVGSRRVTLAGGQRYEFHLEIYSLTANATITCAYGSIAAIRYLSIQADADNGTSAEETNATGTYINVASLGSDIPAGTYIICATYVASCSSLTEDVEVAIAKDVATTEFAYAKVRVASTSDYVPGGFLGVATLGATNFVRIRLRATGAATAKIKNIQLCAIPLPTWTKEALTSEHLSDDLSQTNPSGYVVLKTSNSVALTAGVYLEMISAGLAADDYFAARPYFTGSTQAVNPGKHGMTLGAAASNALSTFWFRRNVRLAGATTNKIEGQINDSTGTIRCKKPYFTWLRESPAPSVKADTPVSIVVDLENGGLLLRSWNATGVARRYRKHLDIAELMSRVIVSGTAYTRLTSTITESDLMTTSGAMADSQWYWRPESQDLYVQFPSGTDPTTSSVSVVAIPLVLVGREQEDLVDSAGTALPYAPRIVAVPGMAQELSSSDARFEVSTSLGKLTLASADGAFDDLLVRHYYEGVRAKVRRGWSALSDDLNDFETVADAVVGMPSSDFSTTEFRLFDRGLNLHQPVATTKITVKEGNSADSSEATRYDQLLPVIWGKVKRCVAYRITTQYGSGAWNEYQFCGHAVATASPAYLDETTLKTIAAANIDSDGSGTYRNAGKVRVKNDAFTDPTRPAERIYVDVVGRTSTGAYTGTPLDTPGTIARDLLTSFGNLAAADLLEPTLRLIDRRWRWQLTSGTWVPTPPKLGLIVDGDETVGEALGRLLGDSFGYWFVSRQGRLGVGVSDYDKANLLINGGFETSSSSAAPWRVLATATLAITLARKYDGTYSAEVSNGGSPSTVALIAQDVILPRPGSYVATGLVVLLSGEQDNFVVGVHLPNGEILRSDPMTIQTAVWTRFSFAFDVPRGDAGSATIYLYPAFGSTTPTTVGIDNVELVPVAFVADDTTALATNLEFRDEHYYEAAVAYDVNTQDESNASKLVMTDGEARGLGTAVNEGKFAVQSSSRADLGTPLVLDTASAAGIAAPLASYYGRTRHVLSIDLMSPMRIPAIGDRLFHRMYTRLPELSDNYPIWMITKVDYDAANAQVVTVEAERQADPVVDRAELAPDSIPMGAITLTLSASGITDYTEVSDLQDMYVRASQAPDLTERGNYSHAHDLSHTHNLPSHDHGTTLSSHGVDTAGDDVPTGWVVGEPEAEAPAIWGPAQEIFAARGIPTGHSHSLPGTSKKVLAASGTSSTPTAALETVPGPNDPAYRRVRFMQRSAKATSLISQDTIVGYDSATIPAGWVRVTALDGYYLRGATSNGSVSTTVATSSYTPNDAGSSLKVASSTNVSVRKRLVVTSGGNTCAVIVTAQNGANDWQVTPLHETGNNTGVSYAVGSTVTGNSDVVNQTYSPTNHDHGLAIPSHAHTAGGHSHAKNDGEYHTLGTASPLSANVVAHPIGTLYHDTPTVVVDHVHIVQPTAPASNQTSGSAGGTISGATLPTPDAYNLVWIKPADANQSILPAGSHLLWTQSSTPPPGYAVVSASYKKLLRGANTGQGVSSTTSGHKHTMTPAAHTMVHNHSGSSSVKAGDAVGDGPYFPYDDNGSDVTDTAAGPAAGGSGHYTYGHSHSATYSIANPTSDPTLQSGSAQDTGTIDSAASFPRHKRILLIRRL